MNDLYSALPTRDFSSNGKRVDGGDGEKEKLYERLTWGREMEKEYEQMQLYLFNTTFSPYLSQTQEKIRLTLFAPGSGAREQLSSNGG